MSKETIKAIDLDLSDNSNFQTIAQVAKSIKEKTLTVTRDVMRLSNGLSLESKDLVAQIRGAAGLNSKEQITTITFNDDYTRLVQVGFKAAPKARAMSGSMGTTRVPGQTASASLRASSMVTF